MKEASLLFALFLFFTLPCRMLQAQEIKTFSGRYAYGEATYSYYEDSSGGRVYHGPFSYERYVPAEYLLRVTGTYKDDLKEGTWRYECEMYDSRNWDEIDKYIISRATLSVTFKEGKMDGLFHFNIGEEGGLGLTYRFKMKDNYVVSIDEMVEEEAGEIKNIGFWSEIGQFTPFGLPHGTWAKEYESDGDLYSDIEEYDNGKLVKKQTKNMSTGEVFDETSLRPYTRDHLPSYAFPSEMLPSFKLSDLFPCVPNDLAQTLAKGEEPFQGVPTLKADDQIFESLDEMPEFPGGQQAISEWLDENINYPPICAENNIQGRVLVSFVVERDGSITEVKVVRDIYPFLDREAVSLVRRMPKWNPGIKDGKPVRCRYNLPVYFRLR